MSDMTPRQGAHWFVVARNMTLGRGTPLTEETEDAAVSYAATDTDGVEVGAGPMAWEAYDFENAWVALFQLPNSPGILKIEVTGMATLDGDMVAGTRQMSLKVI